MCTLCLRGQHWTKDTKESLETNLGLWLCIHRQHTLAWNAWQALCDLRKTRTETFMPRPYVGSFCGMSMRDGRRSPSAKYHFSQESSWWMLSPYHWSISRDSFPSATSGSKLMTPMIWMILDEVLVHSNGEIPPKEYARQGLQGIKSYIPTLLSALSLLTQRHSRTKDVAPKQKSSSEERKTGDKERRIYSPEGEYTPDFFESSIERIAQVQRKFPWQRFECERPAHLRVIVWT